MKAAALSAFLKAIDHAAIVLLITVLGQIEQVAPTLGAYGPAVGAIAALILSKLQGTAAKVAAKLNAPTSATP